MAIFEFVLLVLLFVLPAADAGLYQSTPLPAGQANEDYYGISVASSGSVIAVGAPQCSIWLNGGNDGVAAWGGASGNGYVAIFNGCSSPSSTCTMVSTVTHSAAATGDPQGDINHECFGYSVALTNLGQYLIVGAPNYGPSTGSSAMGAVLHYSLADPTNPVFLDQLANAGSGTNAIGWSVAASLMSTGEVYAAVGMPFLDDSSGDHTGGFIGTHCASTLSTCNRVYYQASSGDYTFMGHSVSMAQGYPVAAIVGTYYDINLIVYTLVYDAPIEIWSCTSANGVTCTLQTSTTINPPSGHTNLTSALTPNWLAVGNPSNSVVYLFPCTLSSTSSCNLGSKTTINPSISGGNFGGGMAAVSVGSVNYLGVSAPDLNTNSVGQAYLYTCTSTSCTQFYTVAGTIANDLYGYGFALNNQLYNMVVGDPAVSGVHQGDATVIKCSDGQDLFHCLGTISYTRSATYSATVSLTHSATGSLTQSATWSVTASRTASYTQSATASDTLSYSQTETASATVSSSNSDTQSATETATPSITGSYTESVTGSYTESATISFTASDTQSATPSATATATASATASFSESLTESATESFTESFTNSATESFTESSTNSATESFTESFTNSYTVSFTHTPSPTQSYTGSFTHSRTTRLHLTFTTYSESATESFTESATVTLSYTGSFTASDTSSDTASRTQSDTASHTRSDTATATRSDTFSATASATASPTFSATASATFSASHSATASASASATASATASPSFSHTASPSVSATASATASRTRSATFSATASASASATASATATITATASATFSLTDSATESATASPTATVSATNSFTASATATAPGEMASPTATPVPSSTLFYYNSHLPTGPGQQPQVTLILAEHNRRRSENDPTFIIVVNATLVACSDPGFFVSDFALPYWLSQSDMSHLAMQFSSLNTTTGLTDYADGPSCDPSTPNNYYFGLVPPPGSVSLLYSPNGCNGSVTSNFDGVFNGTPVDCTAAGIPIATVPPSQPTVPLSHSTPTPSVSADNSAGQSYILPIIIAIVVLVVLCCLILLFFVLYNRREKVRKEELDRFSSLDFGYATKEAPPMYEDGEAVVRHSAFMFWNESSAHNDKADFLETVGGSADAYYENPIFVPNTREHVNPLYEPKTITGTYEPYGEKPTHTIDTRPELDDHLDSFLTAAVDIRSSGRNSSKRVKSSRQMPSLDSSAVLFPDPSDQAPSSKRGTIRSIASVFTHPDEPAPSADPAPAAGRMSRPLLSIRSFFSTPATPAAPAAAAAAAAPSNRVGDYASAANIFASPSQNEGQSEAGQAQVLTEAYVEMSDV